jgi:hypothetical protein
LNETVLPKVLERFLKREMGKKSAEEIRLENAVYFSVVPA